MTMQTTTKQIRYLYEDDQILVIDKPAGLPVQSAGVGTEDVHSLLMKHLVEQRTEGLSRGSKGLHSAKGSSGQSKVANGEGSLPYRGIVHRLDQPVRGLLVFAKTPKAAAALSAQAQDGRMEKTYLALVKPNSEGEALLKRLQTEGEILLTDYLIRDGRTNTSRVASESELSRKDAKEARLILSLPEPGDEPRAEELFDDVAPSKDECVRLTQVRIRLLTGRHHQIRVQLSHAGLPIVGDRKYGNVTGDVRSGYPALCACRLTFLHPATRERLVYRL